MSRLVAVFGLGKAKTVEPIGQRGRMTRPICLSDA
jgi:hypothetical protein